MVEYHHYHSNDTKLHLSRTKQSNCRCWIDIDTIDIDTSHTLIYIHSMKMRGIHDHIHHMNHPLLILNLLNWLH